MRIAIFSEVYWPMVSGVSHSLAKLVEAMEQRGHSCRVYSPEYRLSDGLTERPNVWRCIGRKLPLYPQIQWAFPDQKALVEDLSQFRPDLVHLATEFSMGTAGLRAARELNLPIVASAHTDYERYASRYRLDWAMPLGWRYLRWFYSQAETVLCPSTVYQQHLNNRSVENTALWTRGVDLSSFSPAFRDSEFRLRHDIPEGVALVGCVGRLAEEKNLRVLLEAWRELKAGGAEAHLVLVGDGPMYGELQGSDFPDVTLTGSLTGDRLSEAYASLDIFVFPSSTETFGNVLLEAMASALPALAVGAGGVLDFAVHDVNSWLVKPDDPDELLRGLEYLLAKPELRQRLATGAMRTARSRDWESVFDGVEGAYQRCISHSSGSTLMVA